MEVTLVTWVIALAGLVLMGILATLQFVAVVRPQAEWTIANIYGGNPGVTDPTAYFAFNQGYAWADPFFWAPLQIAGSIGMVLGQRWGFLLALVASVPFWYSAISLFIWDAALGFRQNSFSYWVSWGVWPVFGVVSGAYCFLRLLE